ncbi:MAG: hypothetical protein HY556_11010 [Euryarchaeota archaeon]|nr:hypothetical protein [Euryarchaeota archaeon]
MRFLLALLVLSAVAVAVLPEATAHDSYDGVGAARLFAIPPDVNATINAISYRPDGSEALLVGGQLQGVQTAASRSVIVRYTDSGIDYVLNEEGPALIDVEWAPDGSYALIVGEKNLVYRYENGAVRNVWSTGALGTETYSGRHVSFKPDGSYALLTGNALLKYDGNDFTLLFSSTGNFSNVVSWAPDGSYALIDMAHTYTATENIRYAGDTFFGWLVKYTDVPDPQLQFTGLIYGKYDPERLGGEKHEVQDITFAPDGSYALIVGKDTIGGTILKYFPDVARAGYIQMEKGEGRWTAWRFRPGTNGTEALVTGAALRQIVFVNNVTTLANNSLLTGVIDVWDAAWAPNGTFALTGARGGYIITVEMLQRPNLQVLRPTNFSLAKGTLFFNGSASPGKTGSPVEAIEISFDNSTWVNATVVPTVPGSVNWSYEFNSTTFKDGIYNVTFRSFDGSLHSRPVIVQIYVSNSATVHTPVLNASTDRSLTGNITLHWTTGGDFSRWMVEESDSEDFPGDQRFLYFDFSAHHVFTKRADGTFYYRVRGVTPGSVIGEYSNVVAVTAYHDLDDDGVKDSEEIAAGSDPRDAKSNPMDRDGDGCANDSDKFPDDVRRCTGLEILPDEVRPVLNSVDPKDKSTVTTGRPQITARYSDDVGISTADVKIALDGRDVTNGAKITGTEVTYQPPSALSDGLHAVIVTAKDLAGNELTHAWTFTVQKSASENSPTPGFETVLAAVAAVMAGMVIRRPRRQ